MSSSLINQVNILMHTADVPVENYKLDKIKKLKEEHDAED